jgi:hypothetical protein
MSVIDPPEKRGQIIKHLQEALALAEVRSEQFTLA